MKFINLTDHIVRLNDGTEYQPSGTVARVKTEYLQSSITPLLFYSGVSSIDGLPTEVTVRGSDCPDCVHKRKDGYTCTMECVNMYIVSGIVKAACPERMDLVTPATGHPDCVRREGKVWSVPGFIGS